MSNSKKGAKNCKSCGRFTSEEDLSEKGYCGRIACLWKRFKKWITSPIAEW